MNDIYKSLNIISENVYNLKKKQKRANLQRRNGNVDIYGYEFYRQGDVNSPAEFGISISQDLVYFERFEFKLIIQPFLSSVSGDGLSPVDLRITSNDQITPNPHTHTLTAGISATASATGGYRIEIEGIDLTAHFMAQYDGEWINGEGIYPKDDLSNYDVLKACGYLSDEDRHKILSAGYKKIRIYATAPFNVTLVNYLKYSHRGR